MTTFAWRGQRTQQHEIRGKSRDNTEEWTGTYEWDVLS